MTKKALISLTAGLMFLLIMLLLVPGSGRPSDFSLFLGRFHPAVVHLPIGILFIGVLLEFLSRRWSALEPPVFTLLFAGAWAAIFAAVVGLYLAQNGGYDPGTIAWHKRLGVLIAFAASAACSLKAWPDLAQRPANTQERYGYLASVAALVIFVALTGHLGGKLTHGDDYLTRYMPDALRSLTGLPPKADIGKLQLEDPAKTSTFDALIAPVLSDKCMSCHKEGRSRGGLAVDTQEALMEGGDDGPVIVPGRADESALIHRVWLPLYADGHMPPEGSPQLTVAEAELIRWWIESGASFEEMLTDAEVTPVVQSVLDGYGLDEIKTGIFALDIAPPDSNDIRALEALSISVTALAEDVPFLQVRCIDLAACGTPEFIQALRPLAQNVAWLDLGRTDVGDDIMDVVGSLSHLTRLYLQQTQVTDAGLVNLEGLEYLEYLNLYGTSVGDAALNGLASLPALRSLYLWQTNVTDSAVTELEAAAPNLYVNTGLSLIPVEADTSETE